MAESKQSTSSLVFPVELEGSREVNDKSLVTYYHHTEKGGRGGYFPVGVNTVWHGGVHFYVPQGTDVHSSLPGRIIGVRLAETDDLVHGHYGSQNFILVKHERSGDVFYSLYMHLNNVPLTPDDSFIKKLKWMKNVWYRFKVERNYRTMPTVKGNTPLGTFQPGDEVELVENTNRPTWKKVRLSSGDEVYVSITPNVAAVEHKPNEKLLDKLKSGDVVSLDIPVLGNELLWQSGKAGIGDEQDGTLHWEMFSIENMFAAPTNSNDADRDATEKQDEHGREIDWQPVVDPDDDFRMDCETVMNLFEENQRFWGSNSILDAGELKEFYADNPNAVLLRTYACKFVSEWGIPDLDKLIDSRVSSNLRAKIKERIKPYLWWKRACEAGVGLPDSAHCWHYHPVSVLWALRPRAKLPTLRLGIFFDGTNNDRNPKNIDSFTNVAKLSKVYMEEGKEETVLALYKRGVGTDPGWLPDVTGGAFGAGADARVSGMLYDIQEVLEDYLDRHNGLPERIVLDIFGFSRGAATARHFVNVIKQGGYVFRSPIDAINPDAFHIHFLGVFDTVASFGNPGDNDDMGKTFAIDPAWIEGRVVHFVADDEYRENFDVQTLYENQAQVPTDLEQGSFLECVVPGAHADVGGGYGAGREHGRSGNKLSRIYLHRMHKEAIASGVPFLPLSDPRIAENKRHWAIEPEVEKLYEQLMNYYNDKPGLHSAHKVLKEWKRGKEYADYHLKQLIKQLRYSKHKHVIRDRIEKQQEKINRCIQHINTQRKVVEDYFGSPQEMADFVQTHRQLYNSHIHHSH